MINHPNRSQYALPISRAAAAQWGSSRETHPAVAMAIHAISDTTRSPQTIWEAPTPTEWDHVVTAIAYYVTAGVFDATDDGKYQWGLESINLRATLYTVINASGTVEAEGRTVSEAAIELLTYDGYRYEIRRAEPEWDVAGEPRWDLWHSDGSYASTRGAQHLTCTRIGIYAPSAEAAWPLIAKEVIKHSDWFKGCDVMTDTDYAALQAEIRGEE